MNDELDPSGMTDRDLLVTLASEVRLGFRQVQKDFDSITKKLEELKEADSRIDHRVRNLEQKESAREELVNRYRETESLVKQHEGRFAQLEGAGKGATLVANITKGLLGAVLGASAALGLQVALQPKQASQTVEVHSKQVERVVTPIPTQR